MKKPKDESIEKYLVVATDNKYEDTIPLFPKPVTLKEAETLMSKITRHAFRHEWIMDTAEMFREYFNDYLTVDKFAEHKRLSIAFAQSVIDTGRTCHDMEAIAKAKGAH